MRQRTNQGGSMATYIIIGVILVLGLTIAAYTLKQRGDQVRKDQAISAVDNQDEDTEKAPPVESDDALAPSDDENTEDNSGDVTGSDELPVTGPEDTLLQIVGVGLLAAALTSYISSRRSLASSL